MTATDPAAPDGLSDSAARPRLPVALLAAAAAACASFPAFGDASWLHAALAFAVLAGVAAAPGPQRSFGPARNGVRAEGPRPAFEPGALALLAAAPAPAIVVNRRGVVVLHNARAQAALPGLRMGDPLSFVLRAPEVTEAVTAVMGGRGAADVAYEDKVPVERWYEAHVAPLVLDEDRSAPSHVMITLQDRTAQERLERMRVDFVANASHELRTPLASLSGFIETLQGPAKNDVAARERFLEIMRGQALRMSRLIDDLLSLSRIELNAHVRPQGLVDLRSVVAQTVDALGPLARESGVRLDAPPAAEPMRVRGERDELYRVCENLIENAIKYGGSGGLVEVALVHEPARDGFAPAVALAVRDRGPGIAEEHIPRLTERFYRVDIASSRDKGGTGLGLAIVKHILARHRGRLAIESGPSRGAAFTVRLDAAPEEAA